MKTSTCTHCGKYIYWSAHYKAWIVYNRANAHICSKNSRGADAPHVPK